jgi:hypothetical protein
VRKGAATKKPSAESVARKIVRFTTGQTTRARRRDFYTEDCASHEPGCEPVTGLAALEEMWEARSPVAQLTDWRAVQVLIKTQTIFIEWEALAPRADGTRAPFREIAVYQLRAGLIAEERYYYDRSELWGVALEVETAATSSDCDAATHAEADAQASAETAAETAKAARTLRPPTPHQPAVDFRGHPPIDPLDL